MRAARTPRIAQLLLSSVPTVCRNLISATVCRLLRFIEALIRLGRINPEVSNEKGVAERSPGSAGIAAGSRRLEARTTKLRPRPGIARRRRGFGQLVVQPSWLPGGARGSAGAQVVIHHSSINSRQFRPKAPPRPGSGMKSQLPCGNALLVRPPSSLRSHSSSHPNIGGKLFRGFSPPYSGYSGFSGMFFQKSSEIQRKIAPTAATTARNSVQRRNVT